jgi:osmotically-inducible protein OsmY
MKVKLLAAAMMAAGLALAGCASKGDNAAAGESRTAGQFTSDAALTAKVKTALARDAGLGTAADVNVNSYRGVVQLNGFVDSQDKVQRAADVARSVEGVSRVENNLSVKPRS